MAKTEALVIRGKMAQQTGLTARIGDELRSFTLGPYNAKDPALARIFGGGAVSAGVPVNERTAMNYSAVWSAVNLIAADIGKVPLVLYQRTADGRGKERFSKHPLYRLLHDRPNPQMGSMVFRRTLQAHALVWGNGYAEIERDAGGRPVAMWPLLPNMVEPLMEDGRLRYRVHAVSGRPVILDPGDMLHIRGLSDDGINGYSVIGCARESIGLGIAAERFGATFFGNGATFGGIVSYPAGLNLTTESKKDNRDAIEARHQGVDRAHRLLALYEGADYKQLGVPPNAAQFLETRQFQIEEVCRWFNLPPHKLKHLARSTNNNIEHQGIEYKTDTLDPWWVAWEEELTMKLVPALERGIQVIEHVREGLLQGDQASRGEFYSKLFSIAAITPNEIRQRENLNPIEGGDTVYVPLNTVPLDRLEEYIDAQIKTSDDGAEPGPMPDDPTRAILVGEFQQRIAGLETDLAAARAKAQEWEDKADQIRAALTPLLASEQTAHGETRTALSLAQAKAEQLAAEAHALMRQKDDLARELGESDVKIAEVTAALNDATVQWNTAREGAEQLKTELSARDEVIAVTSVALTESRAAHVAAIAECEDIRSRLADAVASAAQLAAERDAESAARKADTEWLQSVVSDLEERQKTAVASIGELSETLKTTEMERDAAKDEAPAKAQALSDELIRSARAIQEATDEIAAIRKNRDEVVAELTIRDATLAEESAARVLAEQRLQGVVAAQRHVFADAMGRMVRREVAKAKNYQANPRKLAAWMESFYDDTEENIFVEALLPAARLHLAWMGSSDDPAEYARGIAREHFAESKRTLSTVVDVGPEGFGDVLQRTLHRWESTRAEQLADRVMQQEIRHGR